MLRYEYDAGGIIELLVRIPSVPRACCSTPNVYKIQTTRPDNHPYLGTIRQHVRK
jgi:hypothetical protein